MNRFAKFVVARRRWLMVGWLIIFVVGMATSGTATERLTTDFSLPGQQGAETSKAIMERYGSSAGVVSPYIPVVTVPEGSTVAANLPAINKVFDQIQATVPGVRVADYGITKDSVFLTADNRTTYALVYGPAPNGMHGASLAEPIKAILSQAGTQTGLTWSLTGYDLLAVGESSGEAPDVLTETLFGAIGALIVLLFVFASLMAFMPLIIAAVSILSTFLMVLGLTYVTDMSFIVQFLISLVGLGVAIDYSLLVVTRWREERDKGLSNNEAVVGSMTTAGRAVIASAGTVAISLVALLVLPVPFLRSVGIGGMLIPLASAIVCLTLLPAMLAAVGPRIDWPKIRHEKQASRGWTAWARMIVRYRWIAAGVAIVALALMIAPVFGIKIGLTQTDALATSGPAYEALQTLETGGVPAGVVSPLEVLVAGGDPSASAEQVVTKSEQVQGVSAAYAPDAPQWRRGDSALIDVIPTDETVDSTNAAVVTRVIDAVSGVPGFVGVAGSGAAVLDYIEAVYSNFPLVLALVAGVTFLLLARSFRSLLLAFKAVVLNIVSVAATFGATVWFWQEGHGSELIFGIPATGAITFWLPVMIFAFLFGLSMDYEVFILARMREEYDRTGNTNEAVIQGLGRTGRLVTSAALILFLAFIALASSPGTDIKVFATALGIGILLDATIVRALLVPALVSLFGRWNWYLPNWAAKVLFTSPHAAVRESVAVPDSQVKVSG